MKILPLLLLLLAVSTSCNRKGCTDPNALNYDSKAKQNEGCSYRGKVKFYVDYDPGGGAIEVYLTGLQYKGGSKYIYTYGTTTCNGSGGVDFELRPGDYAWYAEDYSGNWWYGEITVLSEQCELILLD